MITAEPFFVADGPRRFLPNEVCRGPWDRNSLHGRVVAGLLAHEVETAHGDPAFQCARLTVDLYRVLPFAPVDVTTTVVRDGNRIRVVDAEFTSSGVSVARASAVLLRKAENPAGSVWGPPEWDVPGPLDLPVPGVLAGPNAQARTPMWETRVIDNGFGSTSQKRAWLRETRQLIDGIELTPLVRVAFASDFTNPFANSGSEGLQFVNADITLYIHRLPRTEWLGFEVVAHHAEAGIAVGECLIHDEVGTIGRSLVCALANRHKPR
ncbi:MAG TPA: thioesterase family protein [Dehalococcoidia bacterium]|nr:thioesterase family protein [Dehalococcoidia bacterium]